MPDWRPAAYWLLLTVRDAILKVRELATAEFATLRARLLKNRQVVEKPDANVGAVED